MAEEQQTADFVIVGAGIAGLRAAIGLAADGARVLVVTKEALGESNTNYAQGGIAVAMSGEEDVALHLEDTVNAGDGLVNREAAAVLVEEGPLRVEELLRWGTDFDREGGKLMLTREGAHSRNRILHAHGDATGAEIGRSLLRHARAMPNITLREWTTTSDLLTRRWHGSGRTLLDRDGASHACTRPRCAAGQRRRWPGLQRYDQSRSRHRRRHRHGLERRRRDRRHGVLPVPSHGVEPAWSAALLAVRGAAG